MLNALRYMVRTRGYTLVTQAADRALFRPLNLPCLATALSVNSTTGFEARAYAAPVYAQNSLLARLAMSLEALSSRL